MRALQVASLCGIVLTVVGAAGAQVVYVPAAAHVGGTAGTNWRTDLEVKAVGDQAASVTTELLLTGQANDDPESFSFTLGAGAAQRFEDVIEARFGVDGSGALRLTATSGSIIVTSRTYNDATTGTFGQFIKGCSASDALAAGEYGTLMQLSQAPSRDYGYRSNLGILNITDQDIDVVADFYAASGSNLGSLTVDLEPYEHRQVNDAFSAAGVSQIADGFIVVHSTTSGAAFFAYASVVDNLCGDAIYIPAIETPPTGGPSPTGDAVIADHYAAMGFDTIPVSAINQARSAFPDIFYGHTSHGSQIVTGLEIVADEHGYVAPLMTEEGGDLGGYGDLTWAQVTRDALAAHPGYDMVIWSWCGGVSDNTAAGINAYLNAMSQLETDYPDVVFVYMTGHLDWSGPDGNLYARNNQIRQYCESNDKVLFDFADIESYDPDGVWYPWDGDWCDWCTDWCDVNPCPSCVDCAHSQCMNCYQKGKAFWWMLARLAGWEP